MPKTLLPICFAAGLSLLVGIPAVSARGSASASDGTPTSFEMRPIHTTDQVEYPDYTSLSIVGTNAASQTTLRHEGDVYTATNPAGVTTQSCQQTNPTEVRCNVSGPISFGASLYGGRDSLVVLDTVVAIDNMQVSGGPGADRLILRGEESDDVYAGSGNDVVSTGAGYDTLNGDAGHDTLRAGADDDSVFSDSLTVQNRER